jgi:hypothetical protein
MRSHFRIPLATMFAIVGLTILITPTAKADWHGGYYGGGGWHGGWGWHGGSWGCCWRNGVFIGIAPPVYVPPPAYYYPPPAYYPPPYYPAYPAPYGYGG